MFLKTIVSANIVHWNLDSKNIFLRNVIHIFCTNKNLNAGHLLRVALQSLTSCGQDLSYGMYSFNFR